MKYVIIKASSKRIGFDYAFPFVFSEKLVHAIAAGSFMDLLKEHYKTATFDYEVLSAGAVFVSGGYHICVPGSETLNIPSESSASENGIRDARLFYLHESTSGVML